MDKTTRFQRMLKILGAMAMVMAAQGCSTFQRYIHPGQFSYPQLSSLYRQTALNRTGSLEVIRAAQAAPGEEDALDLRECQWVAESGHVVAAFGQSSDTYTHWFSLFAFDPYDLTATRKYFFLFNEKAAASPFDGHRFLKPRRVLVFEAELIMTDSLPQPARRETERKVAVLKEATRQLRKDVEVMTTGQEGAVRHYHELASNGMFSNQVLEAAARRLEQFPILADKLTSQEGVEFQPVGLDKGTIWMGIDEQDTVYLTIEVGL